MLRKSNLWFAVLGAALMFGCNEDTGATEAFLGCVNDNECATDEFCEVPYGDMTENGFGDLEVGESIPLGDCVNLSEIPTDPGALVAAEFSVSNFTAKMKKGKLQLSWKAVGPKETRRVAIDRKGPGDNSFQQWQVIEDVKLRQRASFIWDQPGTYQFRMRIGNENHASPYSEVVTVVVENDSEPTNPNPPPNGPVPNDPSLPSVPTRSAYCPASYMNGVYALVDQERRSRGLPSYQYQSAAFQSAMIWSSYMGVYETMTHGYIIGYQPASGQNVAYGYPTPEAVMKGWMNSPGHKANILNGYRYLGVGCYINSRGIVWWTQNFN